MRRTSTLALSAALGVTGSAAFGAEAGWTLLEGIEIEEIITETSYEVKKTFPERLKNGLDGMEITGFAVPLSAPGEAVSELLLVSDMGLCPFCGSSEHPASLTVRLAEPVPGIEEGLRITLKGDMRPVMDPETWQAATMENAVVIVG